MATASDDICNFVVVGQPHCDIAMIVNGLVGCELLRARQTRNKGIVTAKSNVSGVQITACVFSGLGTARNQTTDEIRNKCSKNQVGVLLYCIEVNGLEIDSNGIREGMKKITLAYGTDIWKNALIVFLQANQCAARFNDNESPREDFRRQRQIWMNQVMGVMTQFILTADGRKIVEKLESVVAGNEDQLSLPGEEFWLSSLWKMVTKKSTKVFKKGLSSLTLRQKRIKKKDEIRATRHSIRAQRIWKQPICSDTMNLIGIRGAAILGGIGTGITGATTGALIGALALGIPTFGVAAGLGLVLGGVMGGGIGAGVAGAATGGAAAYRNSQEKRMQDEVYAEQVEHEKEHAPNLNPQKTEMKDESFCSRNLVSVLVLTSAIIIAVFGIVFFKWALKDINMVVHPGSNRDPHDCNQLKWTYGSNLVSTELSFTELITIDHVGHIYELTYDARTHWKNIGMMLKVDMNKLASIEMSRTSHNIEDYYREVLKTWISIAQFPVLQDLLNVLKSKTIGMTQIANYVQCLVAEHTSDTL